MDLTNLKPLQDKLENHSVYQAVNDLAGLRTFMEHHVFCVWDFMSLLKALQQMLAPAGAPWFPDEAGGIRRLINEIVLAEESDEALDTGGKQCFISHYEMYIQAMKEVGADSSPIKTFLRDVKEKNVRDALHSETVPVSAQTFVSGTFEIIETDEPHRLAAAFCLGRENVIPRMFRSLLCDMQISEESAPTFHYYLNRHIELDEKDHWPMSLEMLELLCSGCVQRETDVLEVATRALESRISFWNAVEAEL